MSWLLPFGLGLVLGLPAGVLLVAVALVRSACRADRRRPESIGSILPRVMADLEQRKDRAA